MKQRILGILLLAGSSGMAAAQEVKAVKKPGGAQVADSLYGNVEARIQTYQYLDEAGHNQSSRDLVLRPKLGTKLMNEKLDLNLTLPLTNRQQSAQTKTQRPELEGNLSLVDRDLVSVDIYNFNYIQTPEQPYDGFVDLDIVVKHTIEGLALGKLETSILIEPEVGLATKAQAPTISRRERSDGTALASSEDASSTPEPKEAYKAIFVAPHAKLHLAAVPGLSLAFRPIFGEVFTPRYVKVEQGNGESKLENDGYSVSRSTQVRYTVRYDVSPDVYVYNQLRQNLDGYADASVKTPGAARLDNRTGIVMSLF